MTPASAAPKAQIIPIDRIRIPNPRLRDKRQHQAVVRSIGQGGLKRPITVTRRLDTATDYFDLVAGQGRLEAFQLLGEREIPAYVIEAAPAEALLMSLVENVARRKHTPIALMREVAELNKRGHNDERIADWIGVSQDWVKDIRTLLENGEERLVAGVEAGVLPISLAVDIARSSNKEVQVFLAQAYERGEFTGRKLMAIRRLIDRRMKSSKTLGDGSGHPKRPKGKLTPRALQRIYLEEARKQTVLKRRADLTQARLTFLTAAFKDLCSVAEFRVLLANCGCPAIPQALAARIEVRP